MPPPSQRPSSTGTPSGGKTLPSLGTVIGSGGTEAIMISGQFADGLSAQRERMMANLLSLPSVDKFREWLRSVDGHWAEYCRNYLDPLYDTARGDRTRPPHGLPDDPDPDRDETVTHARGAINNQQAEFLACVPQPQQMEKWTAKEHAVRFVAAVIKDCLLRGVWSARTYSDKSDEIRRAVYEVLSYKRAVYAEGRRQQLQ